MYYVRFSDNAAHSRKGFILATWKQITDDFDVLDDWEDRYRYIIELGRDLPGLDESLRTEANKVQGCVSQVWLISDADRDAESSGQNGQAKLRFRGASDAAIVQGLIAILFSLYQNKTPDEILQIDAPDRLAILGLDEHLTPQRSNGLASMIQRIRVDAKSLAETGTAAV